MMVQHAVSATGAPDVFASTRERFLIPDGVRYFDGNSLGLMPRVVQLHASNVITHEWGLGLIHSWHEAEWRTLPQRAGAKIARLIGAKPTEVVACDSTSVNLFKVVVSAVRLRPGRKTIVTDADAFPTDLYIVDQVAKLFGLTVVAVPAAMSMVLIFPMPPSAGMTYRSGAPLSIMPHVLALIHGAAHTSPDWNCAAS